MAHEVRRDRGAPATSLRTDRGAPDAAAKSGLMLDATDVVVVSDASELFTYISSSCLPLLGYRPAELIGKPVARFVHPGDRTLVHATQPGTDLVGGVRSCTLRYRRKDGSYAWVESRSQAVIDPVSGELRETQAVLRDISERKEQQLAMEQQALTDALTGLANRVLLSDRLQQSLKRLKRNPGVVGVLMLDLDHFKVLNDTLGHQTGDSVLAAVAQRLQQLARPDDTVARFGGDEFVLVVHGLSDAADLATLAERIVAGLRQPFRIGRDDITMTASVGIATTSQADHLAADLIRKADLALYRAKDRGRDRHEVYGEALQMRAVHRLKTERLVRDALSKDRLRLAYQPIVDLRTGMTVEAEALLRIDDPELGLFEPDQFLSVAEEAGLLSTMDEWVRTTALHQLATWRTTVGLPPLARIAVNVTARELASDRFVSRLSALLESCKLEGTDLAIEVTEHVLLQSSNSAVRSLAELRDIGVKVGIDDFGTGFSALSYLQTFPLDFLKIDRSFIDRMQSDARSTSIVGAVTDLAHALDLVVVAEGIENEEQLDALRGFGCDRGQGLIFSKAVSADNFALRLSSGP